ncbi:mitochondrial genome maintenance MGM101 [Xylaria sp. FL1777]|nr:mitochondrial genome maintenance MGM101 [Xylaria sp. FL1777]
MTASRAMYPLRAVTRPLFLVSPTGTRCAARRWAVTTTAKYAQSSTPSSSSTTSRTPPPIPPRSAARPAAAATAVSRKPIPAVSGEPLPDAPPAVVPSPNGNNNNNNHGGEAAAAMNNDPAAGGPIDWTNSYHGLGTSAFSPEASAILQARLDPDDIEVKPDGIIYLPEIKYRRILNTALGPGAWGLAPRGELMVQDRLVTREYALVVHGRFVAQARGEQQYFSEDGVSTAAEGCKSNALMRCCKDLGIASELWDPRFIRKFMKQHAVQQWVEHVTTKKKKQIWLRKDDEVRYPFKKS